MTVFALVTNTRPLERCTQKEIFTQITHLLHTFIGMSQSLIHTDGLFASYSQTTFFVGRNSRRHVHGRQWFARKMQ